MSSTTNDISPARTTVILDKPSDWKPWLFTVKDAATAVKIWQYINPEPPLVRQMDEDGSTVLVQQSLPEPPSEPTIPRPKDVKADATSMLDLDSDQVQALSVLQGTYKAEEKAFQKYENACEKVNEFIMKTVAFHNHTFIQESGTIRQKLLDLKKRLAPTDQARKLDITSEYRKLQKSPRAQDTEKWLSRWETTYSDASAINLPEVQEDRSVQDFLNTIESLDASFVSTQRALIYKGVSNPTLYDIVEEFRNSWRLSAARRRLENHSAFPTFKTDSDGAESNTTPTALGNSTNDANTTSNSGPSGIGSRKRKRPCVCGYPYHHYSKCWYINDTLRPATWKPKENTLKVIQDRLAKDSALANEINEFKQGLQAQSKQNDASTTNNQSGIIGVFTAAYSTVQGEYKLKDHWIIDSGSDIHVCNSQHNFSKTASATETDQLILGKGAYQIECFGTINVPVDTPQGTREIQLTGVAYVPGFMTNLVSLSRLVAKGVHWNTETA